MDKVVHLEYLQMDKERAKRFYSSVFNNRENILESNIKAVKGQKYLFGYCVNTRAHCVDQIISSHASEHHVPFVL